MVLMPRWLESMPTSPAKTFAKQRFLLRLAALYASETGTVSSLAFMIGVNHNTMRSYGNGVCLASERTWAGIKVLLGDYFVPTEANARKNLRDNL